ncbi:MAG: tRNA pseudouridine(13) synthase TruD [Candidatus Woesearchaeota archaeon]|nr:MAG: tRNA pseudouridine(13) synthase TruD [Candidatus Woesearchaeota archaeon]
MKIKQQVDDFKVEELIDIKESKEGDYTYFWLEKKNWNTTRAIKQISRKCGVSIKRFGWAGTKDKTGVTKQLVSVWKIEPKILKNIKLKDIEISIKGRGNKRINLGDLKANRFNIVIRGLTDDNLSILENQIKFVKKHGFPNYFGEQRFGRGNTHLVGKEIIKGRIQRAVKLILTYSSTESEEGKKARKFAEEKWGKWSEIIKIMPKWFHIEKAILNHLIQHENDFAGAIRCLPKKTLKLYVHAYQSYFFNLILFKILSETSNNKKIKIKGLGVCFPLSKFKVPKELPLPGYETKLKSDACSKILKSLLKKEEIELEDFKCKRTPELKSEGTKRETFVKPLKLKVGKMEKDELNSKKKKISLKFDLPSGSYATVLIRSLFLEDLR